MKKTMNWMMAAILVCGLSVFTACSSDDDNKPASDLVDKIAGKWLYVEYDGKTADVTTVEEMTDITVSDNDLCYTSRFTVYKNGEVFDDMQYRLRSIKVRDDYSQIFIGRWEGTITSDDPDFSPKPFCEEYLPNGTNIEYKLVNNQWVKVDVDYAEYFIDGNLLCTRWKYPGQEEERENDIFVSYDNGILVLKALLVQNGHLLYTYTNRMKKVVQ